MDSSDANTIINVALYTRTCRKGITNRTHSSSQSHYCPKFHDGMQGLFAVLRILRSLVLNLSLIAYSSDLDLDDWAKSR